MDEQTRFRTALAALSASAERRGRKLSQADMQAFFQDMGLDKEQYPLVYAYLASKRIQVEGVEMPRAVSEEIPYTEEEQEFLRQYRKDMRFVKKQSRDRLPELFSLAADGEAEAKKLLTEHYMERVLNLAEEYAHQGLLIQDLVQEGSLGLMIGIDTLGLMEEGLAWEEHLDREIHRALQSALEEQDGAKSVGDQVVERLNKLADSITELTEDLGREITPDELSIYLDMPLEEIEDLLRIAGENIEMDDGKPSK